MNNRERQLERQLLDEYEDQRKRSKEFDRTVMVWVIMIGLFLIIRAFGGF
jgi:hypothetical protein